jgi:hypothetical protein
MASYEEAIYDTYTIYVDAARQAILYTLYFVAGFVAFYILSTLAGMIGTTFYRHD